MYLCFVLVFGKSQIQAQYQARIEELKSQGTVISYDVEEEVFDKLTGAIAKRKDRRPYYGNIPGVSI